MTQLKFEVLRPEARALYQLLSGAPELEGLTLMGGTALALQIGHRFSLDFDFATFDRELPVREIDGLISRLKAAGHNVRLITDPALISSFKINTGDNLLKYARDYVINQVKVTLFTHGKTGKQREYYAQAAKLRETEPGFDVMGLDGLKRAKTLVLADRVRSRDLFDLMVLMQEHDYTVEEAMKVIETLGHNDDPEYYKAVLTGAISLDKEDEGLDAVNIEITADEMYTFFNRCIADYEVNLAAGFFARRDSD